MSYGLEWIPGPALVGAVIFLPLFPGLALIALVAVAIAAVAALAALAGAIVATPFLLARRHRRHLAERQQSTDGSMPIATVLAHANR
jgi:hypothetical protein